jgi:HD-GYP domain-containing protein (c-di-GMP phosphodiesterase class II)
VPTTAPSGVRLTELLGALSLAVDLGLGQPLGHVARSCLLAQRLGDHLGLDDAGRTDLRHVAMLGWVGCIADSREAAALFGDDIEYRAGVYDVDMRPLPFLGYLLRRAGAGEAPHRRAAKGLMVVAGGARGVQDSLRAHCQVTVTVARRLGFGRSVCDPLHQVFARWDGRGLPQGLAGADVALPIRLWQLADLVEVHHRRGGADAALRVVRQRSGTQLDPALADLFCREGERLLGGLPPEPGWDELVDGATATELTEAELDEALEAVADWVDIKSPCFSGHSRGVADLAAAAAARTGLPDDEVQRVRRAGLVHDLGRAGVPNTIWDKAAPLTTVEAERIRLHSYYTERMLTRPAALRRIGSLAALTHERLDGSGYHRGLSGSAIPMPARVLAAADAFHTKLEPRPHRPAVTADVAGRSLRDQVRAGRLDPVAVDAVHACAGRRGGGSSSRPAGLTPRELDVLRLLARGATNRQIARQLGIAPKTAGNHVEHIYAKAGVSSRAAAAMFAMEKGLV